MNSSIFSVLTAKSFDANVKTATMPCTNVFMQQRTKKIEMRCMHTNFYSPIYLQYNQQKQNKKM